MSSGAGFMSVVFIATILVWTFLNRDNRMPGQVMRYVGVVFAVCHFAFLIDEYNEPHLSNELALKFGFYFNSRRLQKPVHYHLSHPLERQMIPPYRSPKSTNAKGAVIFLSYIFFALWMTSHILFIISLRARDWWRRLPPYNRRVIPLFGALSLISFASLSWHMLSFLIDHYRLWEAAADTQDIQATLPTNIWRWMKSSSLFVDFARSLFMTRASSWWSRQALGATLMTYLFMHSTTQVYCHTHALPFVLLAEILPISFILNLFFVYVSLDPDPMLETNRRMLEHSPPTKIIKNVVYYMIVVTLLHFFYIGLIFNLQSVADDGRLMHGVGTTRAILFFSNIFMPPRSWITQDLLELALLTFPSIALPYGFGKLGHTEAFLVRFNSAAETLRFDFIVWCVSVVLWWHLKPDPYSIVEHISQQGCNEDIDKMRKEYAWSHRDHKGPADLWDSTDAGRPE